MRKSVSPLPGDEGGSSAQGTRVFGVPLEEVTRTHTISGLPVPALVKHIVDYIEEHGDLDVEGVFLVNGNAERVEWLRRRLDSGEPVQLQREADLASAVSLLRLFLQELPEPVIPQDVQRTILLLHQESGGEEEQCRRLRSCLQQLPQVNYGLLRFLCRFLSSVASLQQESWNVGTLAQVFGPDIFHLSTEAEDVREQESVSRVLAELLDNQEGLFDSEEEDVSTTNDYSSINEQITELLDDDKCEAECEDLPQDGEDGSSQSPQPSPTANTADSSHLSPISILPADSAQIIQETIRAAVEHHFLELKTSIDQDLRSYTNQGDGASEACGRHGDRGQQTERGDVLSETPAQDGQKDEEDIEFAPEESSRMDLDQNILNTARQDNQTCDIIEETDNGCCDLDPCQCDQNANTSETNRNHLSPFPPHSGSTPQLQLFPDNQWEAWPPPHAHLPPIDFSCMHLQKEGQDPVPAYKSWQEESESGEAQLSPLAGRMVPLPPLLLPPEEGGEAGEEGEEGEEGAAFEGERDIGPEMSPSSSARAHPHLLARRFLDFGAHSAQRFLQQDPDSTSPTKAHSRPRRASFGSKEAMRGGDAITHQLTKKLQHLKKKIKQFEEQFEKERNYKPSHGDKAANPKVLKWMTDLTKIRRQIKEAKQRAESELGPQTRPRSNTLPKSFGSTLDQPPRPAPSTSTPSSSSSSSSGAEESPRPSREETAELIQKRVRGKRQDDCWPDDIKKMTKEQLSSEKTVLQKNLLHYEGIHGRPVTREERLVMKPLYDRYRLVKQMLTRVTITPVTVSPSSKRRTQTLQPIIEGETAHFWEEIREEEEEEAPQQQQTAEQGGGDGEETEDRQEDEEEEEEEEEAESSGGETPSPDVIMITNPLLLSPGQEQQPPHSLGQGRGERIRSKSEEEGSGKLAMDLRLSSSNANSMPELLEQLWKTRAEKKQLRKTIRQFEEDFYQHNGRNVQKEDRLPMLEEYKEYKRIKAKLRLLEVLISKQDSSKSI